MEFIETIAIRDGRVINRDGHLTRMQETAAHFGFPLPDFPNLTRIIPTSLKSGLVKCRLLYDRLIRDILPDCRPCRQARLRFQIRRQKNSGI